VACDSSRAFLAGFTSIVEVVGAAAAPGLEASRFRLSPSSSSLLTTLEVLPAAKLTKAVLPLNSNARASYARAAASSFSKYPRCSFLPCVRMQANQALVPLCQCTPRNLDVHSADARTRLDRTVLPASKSAWCCSKRSGKLICALSPHRHTARWSYTTAASSSSSKYPRCSRLPFTSMRAHHARLRLFQCTPRYLELKSLLFPMPAT
jgi:hypothetical protein